jgi:hypothetical protein
MSVPAWSLWFLLSAGAAGLVVWHYRRREPPGRGRRVLAALRATALAVLLLLLFDPELPARGGGEARGTVVLLDASLSMMAPGSDASRTRWEEAVAVARARAGSRPVILFGDRPRAVSPADLSAVEPADARSLVVPALQAAAEAGVRRVVVVSDGGLEDASAAAGWAPRLGLEIVVETVGRPLRNRSLVDIAAPAWAEAGQPWRIDFAVAGVGADSVGVTASRAGQELGRTRVGGADPGRLAAGALELRLSASPDGGWTSIEVALDGEDEVPDDDRRTLYVNVMAEPAGVALVSFQADWEPRFLVPVLERATGLPVRAYLRSAGDRYIRLAGGLDAGVVATDAEIRRVAERAGLLVLHGVGGDVPEWAGPLAQAAPGVLVFPGDGASGPAFGVSVGPLHSGEFHLLRDLPPSPLARLLAGLEPAGFAPLAGLRGADAPAGAWAPLLAARSRDGTPQPVLVAGSAAGRRWAVALGTGYWRWAFRGGPERELYQRFWSAVAGWLVRERSPAVAPAVRPLRLAAPRGQAMPWVAPGVETDSLSVQMAAPDGTTVLDTVVAVVPGDTAFTAAQPPGTYEWRATAFTGDSAVTGQGPLTVETFSAEFARRTTDLAELHGAGMPVRDAPVRRAGTPLHATAWPYALIVLLLAAEWILRRRWGLR